MPYVYILRSLKNKRYYIGSTNDLVRRLSEHNRGHTKSTRFSKPFKLVFNQEYQTLIKARQIELKLKRFKSRHIIDKIVTEQVIELGS